MQTPNLPLQIASGILLAVVVVWVFRLGAMAYQKRDFQTAFFAFTLSAMFGGSLILAGLGVLSW